MSVSFSGPEPAKRTSPLRVCGSHVWALLLAAACIALLAGAAAPRAHAQEAPPADGGGEVSPPVEVTPAPEPPIAAPEPPPAPEPEPPVAGPPADPPADAAPKPPADPSPTPSPARDNEGNGPVGTRAEPARAPSPASGNVTVLPASSPAAPDASFTDAAPLPAAGPGEDWAWTDDGDAFVLATGGTRGDGLTPAATVLRGFTSMAQIAASAAGVGERERSAQQAAQAYADGSAVTISDGRSGRGLFASLFGGGSPGGGGAVLLWFMLAVLIVWRLLPPDWTRAFRSSTATWRPSAYVPPIEHPG